MHQISLAGKRGLFHRVRAASRASAGFPKPDLVIGAGHATHLPLLWLARKHRAASIVMMKPSLPMAWFDLCLIPAHDFKIIPRQQNILVTQGALNRVAPPNADARAGGLVLIGGPSGTHGWDGETLLRELAAICAVGKWQLTDSRRTPAGFIQEIKNRVAHVEIVPHQDTTQEWLPTELAHAAQVWVTEDSVSMIYEALSSGASVGLLPMPRTQMNSRVLRGLKVLISQGFLTHFSDWEKYHRLEKPPSVLREADRCAEVLLAKFRF